MGRKFKLATRMLSVFLVMILAIQIVPTQVFAKSAEQLKIANSKVEENQEKEEKVEYEPQIVGEDKSKREENIKQFRMDDGSFTAAVYNVPVHYKNNNGEYEDIDNTLIEEVVNKEKYYTNKSNDVKFRIPQEMDGKSPIYISSKTNEISFTVDTDRKIKGSESNEKSQEKVQKEQEKKLEKIKDNKEKVKEKNNNKTKAHGNKSKVSYNSFLSDVSYEYDIVGKNLKESIILKRESDKKSFSFNIDSNGLTAKLLEDKTVEFYESNKEEPEFIIEAPFMFDDAKEYCYDIEVTLEATEGGYSYTITPSEEWLKADERQYPVVIDPTILVEKSSYEIKDTTAVADDAAFHRDENAFTDNGVIQFMRVGYVSKTEIYGLIYSAFPSNFNGTERIINASVNLAYIEAPITPYRIDAYQITSDWNTGNIKDNSVLHGPGVPSTSDEPIEYITVSPGDTVENGGLNWRRFDITKAAQNWHDGNQNNYGIMFKAHDVPHGKNNYVKFFDSDYNISTTPEKTDPKYVYVYRNTDGLEDYWSYSSQSAGRAGTGNINNFNGNLVFLHNDFNTVSAKLPVSMSHVYNSSLSNQSTYFGNGWRLNLSQKLYANPDSSTSTDYPYVYEDEDGTKHYFVKDGLTDEDNLGMKIIQAPAANTDGIIEKKDKTKLTFNVHGYLSKISDTNGNEVVITYGYGDGEIYISYIVDSSGNKLDLWYTAGHKKLDYVVDCATNNIIYYNYSASGNLETITYNYGNNITKTSSYTYSGNRLTSAKDNSSDMSMSYNYSTHKLFSNVCRVDGVQMYGKNGTLGQKLQIRYNAGNMTEFEDGGSDGNINTPSDNNKVTYQFDNFGQPTCAIDKDGNASNFKYSTEGGNKNRKLINTGDMQPSSVNLIDDPNFSNQNGINGWVTSNAEPDMMSDVVKENKIGYLDNTSMKVIKEQEYKSAGMSQGMLVDAGTYTFSAYIKVESIDLTNKADSGATIEIRQYTSSGVWQESVCTDYLRQPLNDGIDNGWRRQSITFDVSQNNTTLIVFGGIIENSGVAYFDCFQLEKESAANKYNLIQNSGFDTGNTDEIRRWSLSGISAGSAYDYGKTGRGLRLQPCLYATQKATQNVPVTGNEGDVFMLSGWAKANAVNFDLSNFKMTAIVNYTDGSKSDEKDATLKFNNGVSDWQYASIVVPTDDKNQATNKSYSSIDVTIYYETQINNGYFDNIQLIKDTAQSYVYDEQGNLSSAKTAAESSSFKYDGNSNLTKMVDPTGSNFTYYYDGHNNVISASNSDGINYNFVYNSNGLVTDSEIFTNNRSVGINDGDIYYLRLKSTGQYLDISGDFDVNNTNLQQYDFVGEKDKNIQKCKIEYAGDGYYRINQMLSGSGRSVTAYNNGTADGTNAVIYDYTGADNQLFKIKPVGNGGYMILSKNSGEKLALSNPSGSYGKWVNIAFSTADENNANQIWYFDLAEKVFEDSQPQDGKVYNFRSAKRTSCYMDVAGHKKDDYSDLLWFNYTASDNQRFKLEDVPGEPGYFFISPMHAPDKILWESDLVFNNQYKMTLGSRTSPTGWQKYKFIKNSNNTYSIVAKGTYSRIDNYAIGAIENSTSEYLVTLPLDSNDKSQQWYLEECENRITSSTAYDSTGSLVRSTTDSRGTVTENTYNNKKQVASVDVKDSSSNVLKTNSYEYDEYMRLKKVSSEGSAVSYNYNNDDSLKTINHGGFNYNFTYDNFGRQQKVAVGNQTLITNEYNNYNDLINKSTYGNNSAVQYSYDNKGALTGKTYVNPGKANESYTYKTDLAGNILEKQGTGKKYLYTYDMIGRPTTMRTEGFEVGTLYDSKNRTSGFVWGVFNSKNNSWMKNKTSYIYGDENLGQMPSTVYNIKRNDVNKVTYGYDELCRRDSKTLNLAKPYKTSYTYLNNSNNTTTTLVESVTNGNETLKYVYDALGNIKQIKDGAGTVKASYQYDKLNQLVKETVGSNVFDYAYDTSGNIQSVKKNGTAIKTYGYTDANWKDKLTSFNGQTISYDQIGNPLSYRDGMKLTWQNGRQLASFTKTGTTASYTYDDSGIRTSKTVNGVKTDYYLSGSSIVTQISGNDVLNFFYDESGDVYGFEHNGSEYSYIRNAQNDIIGILNSTGEKVVSYDYDSWGNILSITGTQGETIGKLNPFRYRGYYYDNESGLYYLQSRYYDSVTSRFINADSVVDGTGESVQGYNLFSYCMNNPVNMSDESGHWPKWATKVLIGVAVIATLAVVTIATAGSGTALACIAAGALKGAIVGAAVGAATGAATAVVQNRVKTKSWKGSGKAALEGGADGFMTGSITGAITGGIKSNVCFVAGTSVLTSAGHIAIENIRAGDKVWSENPETGEKALKEVVRTFENETNELVHVYANGEEIVTTPEHPFYVINHGWTGAIHLRAGDILVLQNGRYVVVEKIQHEILETPIKVYNFEVADFHTYYVSDSSILVHNMCKPIKSKIGVQKGKAPRSNTAQNKQFDSVIKEFNLDKSEARMLHDSITGQGYDRKELIEELISIFPDKVK